MENVLIELVFVMMAMHVLTIFAMLMENVFILQEYAIALLVLFLYVILLTEDVKPTLNVEETLNVMTRILLPETFVIEKEDVFTSSLLLQSLSVMILMLPRFSSPFSKEI